LQPEPLFHRGIAAQLNLAPSSKYALPGQSEPALQNARDHAGPSRVSRSLGHTAIRQYFPLRDLSNYPLD
jgi:hypothetical protein